MIEAKPYELLEKLPRIIADNHVLIKIPQSNKELKTKSGIFLTSGKSDDKLDNNDVFDQIERYGTIVMVSKNFFDPKSEYSLRWDTPMEVKVGDTVWIRQIEANVAARFKIKGEMYKIVKYDSLNLIKRDKKIIPLNGQIIATCVIAETSKLIETPFKVNIADQGIIRYIGTPNKDYLENWGGDINGNITKVGDYSDEPYSKIKPNSRVQYQMVKGHKNVAEIFIESGYINSFKEKYEGVTLIGNMLKTFQRRHIIREF